MPLAVDPTLPPPTAMGYVSFDALDPSYRQQGVYQIVGWGFPNLEDGSSIAEFERQVVLSSSDHTYVFPASSGLRKDIKDRFSGLKMDVYASGFTASINKNWLPPGRYSIGMLFIPRDGSKARWVISGRCLVRTPNQLQAPDPKDQTCPPPRGSGIGRPTAENALLPPPVADSAMGIDSISVFNDVEGIYKLEGWGFFTSKGSRTLGEYRRRLVLISGARKFCVLSTAGSETGCTAELLSSRQKRSAVWFCGILGRLCCARGGICHRPGLRRRLPYGAVPGDQGLVLAFGCRKAPAGAPWSGRLPFTVRAVNPGLFSMATTRLRSVLARIDVRHSVLPVLLGIFPAVFHYANNVGIAMPWTVFRLVAAFGGVSLTIYVVCLVVLRNRGVQAG